MGSSYTDINIHIIFHTKDISPVMKEEDLSRIFHYIGGIIRALHAHVYMVGGRPDHIHILASLPVSLSLSDYVRKIKSNSSRWMKSLGPDYKDFTWQEGGTAHFPSVRQTKMLLSNIFRTRKDITRIVLRKMNTFCFFQNMDLLTMLQTHAL